MNSKISLEAVVQIVASIAALVGLALVVSELQQNREAMTSQLTSDGVEFVSSLNVAVVGEQAAEVLAKACDDPQALTTADYYVLDNFYAGILHRYRRIALLAQRGSFYDSEFLDADMGLGNLFDSAPGRAYLKTFGIGDDLIGQTIESKIAAWDGTTCLEYFGEWLEAVRNELEE